MIASAPARGLIAVFALALASCGGRTPVDVTLTPQGTVVAADAPPPVRHLPAPRLAKDTRPLPADIAQYRRIREVAMSPVGDRVLYALQTSSFNPKAEPEDKADHSGGWTRAQQIFVVEGKGGSPRQLTFGDNPAHGLAWSPDGGTVGFLRERGREDAVHVMSMRGGEARVIDTGELRVSAFSFTADGKGLYVLATPPRTDAERREQWRRGGAYSFDRNWRPASLYRMPFTGKPVRVNVAGHVAGFREAPDGRHLAVVTASSSNPYQVFTRQKLSIIHRDGSLAHAPMTEPACVGTVRWSPSSRYVAFTRCDKSLSLTNHLHVFDMQSGKGRDVASGHDLSLAGFVWRPDSRGVVAHVQHRTKSKLVALGLDGKARDVALLPYVVSQLSASNNRRAIAVSGSSSSMPHAVGIMSAATGRARWLVSPNPEVGQHWKLGATRLVSWKNKEGVDIEGILTVSPHATPGTPGPLMVLPHGGPDSVSTERFDLWAAYFAARGYSVLRPNYRGGFGYGYDFYAANRGRLGDIEFLDIESGVDHLIATGVAAKDKLYYGGWSWGGYITTWTITKTTRYRAAVVGAGVVDTVVQYVTSDINHGVVGDWEFRGRPWRKPESYARSNPALSLGQIKTPTLVLHGEQDDRVAFVNGQTLYRALDDAGTEVVMLAYPREPHNFREPAHTVHMLEAWAHHFDSH